jgi:hypothetical protein
MISLSTWNDGRKRGAFFENAEEGRLCDALIKRAGRHRRSDN